MSTTPLDPRDTDDPQNGRLLAISGSLLTSVGALAALMLFLQGATYLMGECFAHEASRTGPSYDLLCEPPLPWLAEYWLMVLIASGLLFLFGLQLLAHEKHLYRTVTHGKVTHLMERAGILRDRYYIVVYGPTVKGRVTTQFIKVPKRIYTATRAGDPYPLQPSSRDE